MLDGLGKLVGIFGIEDLGLQEILPVGLLLFVDGYWLAVYSVHDDQDDLAGNSNARREENPFVSSVDIQQELLDLLSLFVLENYQWFNCLGRIIVELSYKSHISEVLTALQVARILTDCFEVLDQDPHLVVGPILPGQHLSLGLFLGGAVMEGKSSGEIGVLIQEVEVV